MKRTALIRRTPLRAKPGARLAHASDKRAERLARYKAMLDGWQGRRGCAKCGHRAGLEPHHPCAKCGHRAGLEPHHPYGRGRENLFRVVLLCHLCHACTHEFSDTAYELGWLQPEYRNVLRPPNFPVPWLPKSLITDILAIIL